MQTLSRALAGLALGLAISGSANADEVSKLSFTVNDLNAEARTTPRGNVFVHIESRSGDARLVYNPVSGKVHLHDIRNESRVDPATKERKRIPVEHRYTGKAPTRLSPQQLVEHLELAEGEYYVMGGGGDHVASTRGFGLQKIATRTGDNAVKRVGLKTRLQNAWKTFRGK